MTGDAGESYYLIVSGTVDVMIEEGGAPKYLNILKSGQGFGEVALVNKVCGKVISHTRIIYYGVVSVPET